MDEHHLVVEGDGPDELLEVGEVETGQEDGRKGHAGVGSELQRPDKLPIWQHQGAAGSPDGRAIAGASSQVGVVVGKGAIHVLPSLEGHLDGGKAHLTSDCLFPQSAEPLPRFFDIVNFKDKEDSFKGVLVG